MLLNHVLSSLTAAGMIVVAMVIVAVIETAIPLHPRGRWNCVHLVPNLALTAITLATNVAFNVVLVITLDRLHADGTRLALPAAASVATVVVVLDFATFCAHVAMHQVPSLWAYHCVHHADPAVDVTTTIRQHPGESVVRYVCMAAGAVAVGAGPGAFAVYRVWSALQGLVEHANIRLPPRLDSLLTLVFSTPNMHKIHHSRAPEHTDMNYGNIFAVFDRMFRTFVPSRYGVEIAYGLDGLDEPAAQTTAALLALPFRGAETRRAERTRPATGVASR